MEVVGGGNGSRFVAIDDVPSWLSGGDAWRLVDFPNGYIEQQTLNRVPGFYLRPYISMRPDIRTFRVLGLGFVVAPRFCVILLS